LGPVTAKEEEVFQGVSGEVEPRSSGGSYVAGVVDDLGYDGRHASTPPN
jgi:hypothetical protein